MTCTISTEEDYEEEETVHISAIPEIECRVILGNLENETDFQNKNVWISPGFPAEGQHFYCDLCLATKTFLGLCFPSLEARKQI